MRDRHVVNISNDVTSALGLMFAGGPSGFFFLAALGTFAALSLQVLLEPGIAFAGAAVLVLPFVAWRIGRVRTYRGRLVPARLAAAGTLLLAAFLAYQIQWGALGNVVKWARSESCAFHHLHDYGMTAQASSWFMGCRDHFDRAQKAQACARLLSGEETRTLRIRMYC